MDIPEELLYTKEHEWVSIDSKSARVGITTYAQEQLGDITFVELPEIGKTIKQFEQFTTIESVKAASDVYAPMSGVVVEVNKDLENTPELMNQSPYEKGWIAEIEISDQSEKNKLMDAAEYEKYIANQSK